MQMTEKLAILRDVGTEQPDNDEERREQQGKEESLREKVLLCSGNTHLNTGMTIVKHFIDYFRRIWKIRKINITEVKPRLLGYFLLIDTLLLAVTSKRFSKFGNATCPVQTPSVQMHEAEVHQYLGFAFAATRTACAGSLKKKKTMAVEDNARPEREDSDCCGGLHRGKLGIQVTCYQGEYHTLFKELEDDEICFYKYFRMSRDQFYVLLSKIEKQIQKKNSTFREAISAKKS
nr:unnamed protein product [Callosobruchus chinensis]